MGGFGRAGVFGFYPNKQITTGEGGMIVTDDDRLASLCRSMRNQGRADMAAQGSPGYENRTGSWLAHERLGYNYRLNEICRALGRADGTAGPDAGAAAAGRGDIYAQACWASRI